MALSTINATTGLTDGTVTSAKLADFAAAVDLNGVELVLDADADTSITADTDDRIDFKIAGVEHFSFSNSSGDTIIKPMVDAKDIKFQQFDGRTLLDINDAGFVGIENGGTGPGTIRIFEDSDLGSNYVGLSVGNVSTAYTLVFPNADGSSGQVMTTNGSGVLSFSSTSIALDDVAAGDGAVTLTTSSGNITIDAAANDSDIIFKGTDGGADKTFATFDGSAGGDLFLNGGLIDLKNDGSNVSQIKFYCESSNAHAQTLIGAPHAQAADNTLTLPDGADGVLLSTTSTATVTNKTLTSPIINTGTFGTSILPTSADGTTLGSASKEFSDLFLADASTIQFGADQDVILTHVADTGLLLSGTNVIQFNDASQNIGAPSNAILDINATDEIELNATLVDINANVEISGTAVTTGVHTFTAIPVLPANTIDSDMYVDGSIDTAHIADSQVTLAKTTGLVGKQTIWVPAQAMTPTSSNGCAVLTTVETTSGRPDMNVLDFDKDSDEFAQFSVAFPKAWNAGTITFQFFWSGIAATTGVAMSLQGVSFADNDSIDTAYGTAVVVQDDAQGAVEELLVSAESGAVTIAGSPGDNELCYFRVGRDVSDSNDDMAGDCRLHGIKLFFTNDALNDA